MSEDTKNTPTTVRELGIQFQGFQGLVDERFKTLSTDIQRLAKALEDSNKNKADLKDHIALKDDFETYKKDHAQVHIDLEVLVAKKPVLQILLWSIFGSLITAVVVYEVTKSLGGN